MIDSVTGSAAPEPPFYRGELCETVAGWCDRIVDGGDACDDLSAYLVEWKQQPCDNGTTPISGCCERHALDVDRAQVVRMATWPGWLEAAYA